MALRSEERRRREYEDGKYDEFGEFMPAYAPQYDYADRASHDGAGISAFIRSAGGVLALLLLIRFVVSLFTSDVSGVLVATIYSLTNWLVAPFNTLLGIIPTGVSGFFDLPALAAAVFVVGITAVVNWLIRSVANEA